MTYKCTIAVIASLNREWLNMALNQLVRPVTRARFGWGSALAVLRLSASPAVKPVPDRCGRPTGIGTSNTAFFGHGSIVLPN